LFINPPFLKEVKKNFPVVTSQTSQRFFFDLQFIDQDI